MGDYTQHGCEWETETGKCGVAVEGKHWYGGVPFCREHALWVWSVIDEEILKAGKHAELRAARQAEREQELAAHSAARQAEFADLPPLPTIPGYVYYIRVGPHIKIGYASNLEKRLASYPPDADLLAVEHGSMKDEMQLHRTFKPFLASGREWYSPRPVLMDHIAKVAENEKHTWWDESEWRRKRPASDQVVKMRDWSGR